MAQALWTSCCGLAVAQRMWGGYCGDTGPDIDLTAVSRACHGKHDTIPGRLSEEVHIRSQ